MFSIIFITPDAFGKHGNISTDKEAYYDYETIKITGDVDLNAWKASGLESPTQILIRMDSNYSKKLYQEMVDVDENGKIYHEIDLKNISDVIQIHSVQHSSYHILYMMGGHESRQEFYNSAHTYFHVGDVKRYHNIASFKNGEPQFTFENKIYTSNDIIIITGNVTDNKSHVLDIFDPDGARVAESGFKEWVVDGNTIMAKVDLNRLGVDESYPYKRPLVDGTYTMKIGNGPGINHGEYGTYEFDFIFSDLLSKQFGDEMKINFDKKFYTENDFIIINGTIPEKLIYDTAITMTVKDPYDELIIDVEIRPQHNGYFYTPIHTKNLFTVTGDYILEMHGKHLPEPITKIIKYHNPNLVDVKKLDSQVQTIDSKVIQLDDDSKQQSNDIAELRNDTDTLRTDVNSLQVQFDNFSKFVNEQLAIIFNMFADLENNNSTNPN